MTSSPRERCTRVSAAAVAAVAYAPNERWTLRTVHALDDRTRLTNRHHARVSATVFEADILLKDDNEPERVILTIF